MRARITSKEAVVKEKVTYRTAITDEGITVALTAFDRSPEVRQRLADASIGTLVGLDGYMDEPKDGYRLPCLHLNSLVLIPMLSADELAALEKEAEQLEARLADIYEILDGE